MIDWKEACRGIRKRERATKAWWRAYGTDWRDAALYWMRRADDAEKRVGALEDILRAMKIEEPAESEVYGLLHRQPRREDR